MIEDPTKVVTGDESSTDDGSVAQAIANISYGWSALQSITTLSPNPPIAGATSFTNYYSANIARNGRGCHGSHHPKDQ